MGRKKAMNSTCEVSSFAVFYIKRSTSYIGSKFLFEIGIKIKASEIELMKQSHYKWFEFVTFPLSILVKENKSKFSGTTILTEEQKSHFPQQLSTGSASPLTPLKAGILEAEITWQVLNSRHQSDELRQGQILFVFTVRILN